MENSLKGIFNGKDLDTLISKPLKSNSEGICNKWRIFTKNGTVKELTINEPSVDIQFIREGDLDNNGTEEWGYLAQPENSLWNVYHLYTYHKGEWVEMIEPLLIYLPDFTEEDNEYSIDDIIQKSESKGYVKAKYSKLNENGLDFSVVDTLIKINPILLKD